MTFIVFVLAGFGVVFLHWVAARTAPLSVAVVALTLTIAGLGVLIAVPDSGYGGGLMVATGVLSAVAVTGRLAVGTREHGSVSRSADSSALDVEG